MNSGRLEYYGIELMMKGSNLSYDDWLVALKWFAPKQKGRCVVLAIAQTFAER